MSFLPSVVNAKHIEGFRVHLAFNDGVEAVVDFERWLTGPVFQPLRTSQRFSELFVDGGGVAWPNGADISPEALYEAALAARLDGRFQPTTAVREKRAKYKTSRRRRG
ncbi:MAG TPA: DUF2442 domain-containing protein [Vicinamibacterales bacterium]|nr:DUF2442 domain-containing protein [Vicinamibacterales bacterium]